MRTGQRFQGLALRDCRVASVSQMDDGHGRWTRNYDRHRRKEAAETLRTIILRSPRPFQARPRQVVGSPRTRSDAEVARKRRRSKADTTQKCGRNACAWLLREFDKLAA